MQKDSSCWDAAQALIQTCVQFVLGESIAWFCVEIQATCLLQPQSSIACCGQVIPSIKHVSRQFCPQENNTCSVTCIVRTITAARFYKRAPTYEKDYTETNNEEPQMAPESSRGVALKSAGAGAVTHALYFATYFNPQCKPVLKFLLSHRTLMRPSLVKLWLLLTH